MDATRAQVLAFRLGAHQLERTGSHADAAILDLGVQDTGPDGSGWALRVRGVGEPDVFLAWTLRGAPHAYRRADTAAVAAATAPYDDADAGKRIFDAAKPLRDAGIDNLEALDVVAAQMRDLVRRPIVKGDLSTALTQRLPPPYVRYCRPCQTTHSYEQTFRLSALRAGIELQPSTSPPVLERIKGWRGPSATIPPRLDVIRGYLRFFGPATTKQVAAYVDAPVSTINAHLPTDLVEVSVEGERRLLLADDVEALGSTALDPSVVRLLGPFDPWLQGRDRELMVPDEAHRKDLWRTLGRPGAVLAGAEVVGTWRPRSKGRKLALATDLWAPVDEPALAEQATRLAAYRGMELA